MNVSSIALGLALGAIDISLQTRAILAKPLIRPLETAFTCIMILAPFCAELVLIVRVVAVYPPYSISWSGRLLVYAPIAALKIARTVNLVLCVVTWVQLNADATNFSQSGHAAWDLPNVKVEWILQLVDMTFVSALFLARLQKSTRIQHKTSVTLSSRIRTLFWIAASNLVFPVLLNIIQLWYIFRDKNFFHGTYVYFVNVHVQIIGALLATIWSAGMQRPSTFPVNSDNVASRRRREVVVIDGLQPAGNAGLQRATVSPSEWLQTWTAASDASTDPGLGRRDRMFDVSCERRWQDS
ncbi:hypothetical protein GY45DRAFT_1331127 [Cubamyces sp. BRFM 1775]|nr:hypothetical protein GY45DRAFT_1331127 [Cubamyces sp. BRFM 1775]